MGSLPDSEFPVGPRDAGKRLDAFLHERIPGLSRTRIQRAIRERVTLSWDVEPRPARPVIAGGVVRLAGRELHEVPLEIEIPVVVRGDGWLVVDKPAGIPVHPVNRVLENSLIRILRRQERCADLRLTHRLDRETSGALLVADNPATARALAGAFERGDVEKEYVALVVGSPDADGGTIELPIDDTHRPPVFVRCRIAEPGGGKPASTHWEVARRYERCTLVRAFPKSGRRHQIRVHLHAIGHPVMGDILYGRPDRDYLDLARGHRDVRAEEGGPTRQLLHARRLVVPAPGSPAAVEVVVEPPREFDDAAVT